MNSDAYDVAIVGGGLVGAALAAALRPSGRSVALIEPRPPEALPPGVFDTRIYAISPANAAFLERLGAWAPVPCTPIRRMQIHGDAGGRLAFDHRDAGVDALGYIAEGGRIASALWAGFDGQDGLAVFAGAGLAGVAWGGDAHRLRLTDGQELTARLVVAADGGQSPLRQMAELAASVKPYGQKGVVANFACEKPHLHVARQWFGAGRILAWLPLGERAVSMVWSVEDARAEALLAMDARTLAETVAAAGGRELGEMALLNKPAAFPLRLLEVPRRVRPRLALVGDAAHGVHPLAGQGVNLGFADARALADLLTRDPRRDSGDWLTLRAFERARKEEVWLMQRATDALNRLFGAADPLARWLRNAGLAATDRQRWLKNLLIGHAVR